MRKPPSDPGTNHEPGIHVRLIAFLNLVVLAVPLAVSAATYTVSTQESQGDGSLLAAILQVNASPERDTIMFASGVQTIYIDFQLPPLTNSVIIDGTGSDGQPGVELRENPSKLITNHGLWIRTTNCIVRGLVINSFTGAGIALDSGGGHVVQGNLIFANGLDGIVVLDSTNNWIGGVNSAALNVVSGNNRSGIALLN